MTAKSENIDSLSFSVIERLLKKICKSLGFKFSHEPFYGQPAWLLYVDNDVIVFLGEHDRGEFETAKDLLKGILAVKTFMLRSLGTWEEKIISNPFCGLNLCELEIKLDLLA